MPQAKDGLIAKFPVYPEQKQRLRAEVLIYRTAGDMRRAVNQDSSYRRMRRSEYSGICVWTDQKPCFARVYFRAFKLWDVVVVHEMLHVAFEWARLLKLSQDEIFSQSHRVNERFVEAHARMVRQFWTGYIRHHLYGEAWYY